jgi:phytoene dehydrogenase-like protein
MCGASAASRWTGSRRRSNAVVIAATNRAPSLTPPRYARRRNRPCGRRVAEELENSAWSRFTVMTPEGQVRGWITFSAAAEAGEKVARIQALVPDQVSDVDAVVVGAGPNGLAAAVTLAAAGLSVQVVEGASDAGGGCRTEALTLPGFAHDVCSSIHPLAMASPFFRRFDLAAHGVRLLVPEASYAQPLAGGRAAVAYPSLDRTVAELGADGASWRRLMQPLVDRADAILPAVLAPLRGVPPKPLRAARFAPVGPRSASALAARLTGENARALFAGVAAHAMLPLDRAPSGGFGAVLALLAHSVGWPAVEGGSRRITDALVNELKALGGSVVTGEWVRSLDQLPRARAVLLDLAPRQLLELAGDRLPSSYVRALSRYRYGPGVCKVDWALGGPVPWSAAECARAATVHVGGAFEEVARSEAHVAAGRHPEAPYVLVVQAGVVDPGRAPTGHHALWGYCHVPPGSTVDMSDRIEAQIERFAPGFRDLILARSVITASDQARRHPNYVGGDINVGMASLRQTIFRPTVRWNNYATPLRGIYLCSAATPPGGGVHGQCGMHAADAALRREFGRIV